MPRSDTHVVYASTLDVRRQAGHEGTSARQNGIHFHLAQRIFRLGSASLLATALCAAFLFASAPAHAVTANGNCASLTAATSANNKDYRYGFPIGSWTWDGGAGDTLAACDNWGPDDGVAYTPSGAVASAGYGASFQCVELILRYFNARWGIDPAPYDQDASAFWTNYPSNIFYQVSATDNGNGTSNAGSLPYAGDIMVFEGSPGHIAIVANVTATQIILFEQNTYFPNIGYGIDGATNAINYTTNADGTITINATGFFGWLDSGQITGFGAAVLATNTGIGGPLLSPAYPLPPQPAPEKWTGKLANGALFAAKHDANNQIAYRYQMGPASQSWSAWTELPNPSGDTIVGDPAIGTNDDYRLYLFARGASGKIWISTQVSKYDPTQWHAWSNFTNPSGVTMASDPAVEAQANGALYLFVRDTNGVVHLQNQTSPGGPWLSSGYTQFSNPSGYTMTGNPAVIAGANRQLYLFVRDNTGAIRLQNQTKPNGGWLSTGYTQFTNPSGHSMVSDPTVAAGADGRLYLFVIDNSGVVRLQNQNGPNGAWISSGYTQFTNPSGVTMTGDPAIAANTSGELYLFVRDTGGVIRLQNQTQPNGGWLSSGYSQFSNQPGVTMTGDPAANTDSKGYMSLFAIGSDHQMYQAEESNANGPWQSLTGVGGSF